MINFKTDFDQKKVDKLMSNKVNNNRKEKSVPKGISQRTLNKFIKYLKQIEKPKSAQKIASENGVTRITARRYLEYLVEKEEVDIKLTYGSVGRPTKKYFIK